jgi:hypothetical protein
MVGRSRVSALRWCNRVTALNVLSRATLGVTTRAYWAGLIGTSGARYGVSLASKLDRAALQQVRRRRSEAPQPFNTSRDLTPAYVLKRFLLKLAFLLIFALAQIRLPWGFANAVGMLAALSAVISVGLAVFSRERPVAAALNHWSEAIAFVGIGAVAYWLT